MRQFRRILAMGLAAVTAVGITVSTTQAFVIDDFSNYQTVARLSTDGAGTTYDFITGGMVGGNRVTAVTLNSGTSQGVESAVVNNLGQNEARLISAGDSLGSVTYWWDGDNNSTIDLGNSYNYKAGGANALHSTLAGAPGSLASVKFTAYEGGTSKSYTYSIPSGGSSEFWIPYTWFPGIDFSQLNALSAELTSGAANNEYTYLTGPVGLEGGTQTETPEPGTFALMGVLVTLGGARLRRMMAGQKQAA